MKNFLLLSLLVLTVSVAANAQATRAEPVPGMPTMIMGPGDFENITFPAQMERFGDISESEKKMRVDMYLSLISPTNTTIEFVIALSDSGKDRAARVEWFSNYFKKKKIAAERYSFAFGETQDGCTELWFVPNKNVALPANPSKPVFKIIGAEDTEALKQYTTLPKTAKP